ncbi:MAG: PAQR family membrane homeostasis protein TrhA [Phycisphaerales bacterium]
MASETADNLTRPRRFTRHTNSAAAWAKRTFSRSPGQNEEKLNAATHGVGWLASVVGAVVVLAAAFGHGGAWQVGACVFYSLTMVAAYGASTLSHSFSRPRLREFFRGADQAVIFLFIAGSYTPIALTWLRGGAWWWLHGMIWAVAMTGFISKAVFSHNVRLGNVTTWLYVLVGWMPVLATGPLIAALPTGLLIALFSGGVCYTLGLIFFHYDHRVRYCHTAWHVAVVAGSACHYLGVLFYCTSPARM